MLTCSLGEKQKLLISRALMASPKLLILDEATNGLNFFSREALVHSLNRRLTPSLHKCQTSAWTDTVIVRILNG